MQIKTLAKTSKQLEIEITNENETLLNPLVQVLLQYKEVDFASIAADHPLGPTRRLYIRLKGGVKTEPLVLLKKAVKQLSDEAIDLRKGFEEEVKKAEKKK
ncbi:MAG: DNA-directed RNA polymerase subunit L [Candidatus Thermoplasmatota archaeon]|jgi:DNA-directed RNA polymerase subunit L|nr:DNA-directed RNA polymerase subunit L [Candidatus Thermoplasmatota archaeon]